jgi:hypothetical protein
VRPFIVERETLGTALGRAALDNAASQHPDPTGQKTADSRGPTSSLLDEFKLQERLDALSSLSIDDLRKEWRRYYSSKTPASMSRELLQRAIGFKMQEQACGGLTRHARIRLAALRSTAGRMNGVGAQAPVLTLKPGTKLLREWQGKIHEVLALDDGQFAYAGNIYGSLTAIALLITGAHWSGPRFFGLKNPKVMKDG